STTASNGEVFKRTPSPPSLTTTAKLENSLKALKHPHHHPHFTTTSSFSSSSSSSPNFDLNVHEAKRLEEISVAMQVFHDETQLPVVDDRGASTLIDCFNAPGNYVQKYCSFCKGVEAFRVLSAADQLAVMKQFYCEISAIRFSFLFDVEKDGFLCVTNEAGDQVRWIYLNIFGAFGRTDLERLYRRFCTSMKREMEGDETLRNLIISYFLFHKRETISCPEYIAYCQSIYRLLLRRYLEAKLKSRLKAEKKFSSLMAVLSQVDYICKTVEEVYLSFEPEKLAQVIAEIYNKK
ncbi:zinc ion binding, partial [Tyrophagus putrescentiae]